MNNGSGGRDRFPFTATQWEELEQQALIFKYIISGIPIPPHLLLFSFKPTLFPLLPSSSSSSNPNNNNNNNNREWSCCLQMGLGRRFDPEPGRCRRTDGKKWRCSKEAFPDSKYCDKHMHRGKNRSRKPNLDNPTTTPQQQSLHPHIHFLRPCLPQPTPLQFLPRNREEDHNYRNGMYVKEGEEEVSRLQFAPLTMGSSLNKVEEKGGGDEMGRTQCFLEEWQWKSRKGVEDGWCSSSSSSSNSMTQLSISIPVVSTHIV